MKIRNPRTGVYDYEIAQLSSEELTLKLQNLRQAQDLWKTTTLPNRIEALNAWLAALQEEKDELIEALSIDTGAIRESTWEVEMVGNLIAQFRDNATRFFEINQGSYISDTLDVTHQFEPYPLVGVISAWRLPFFSPLIDAIPALLAGCAVVVKPSELTPRFVEVVTKTLAPIPLLASVFTFLAGDKHLGQQLSESVDLVCFKGSQENGKRISETVSQRFIPAFLQLQGKNAVIVTEQADIERASSAIVWGSVFNAGQTHHAIERIYVHRNAYPLFLSRLVGKANLLNLAFPTINSGEIAPIISEKQVAIIDEQLRDATSKGGTIIAGSQACELKQGGYYCQATVLTNVNHQMKIMKEPTFAPILAVMVFQTIEEAITLANDSLFGLEGAVFAGSDEEAMEIAQKMNCGAVSINDTALTVITQRGINNFSKQSGLGTGNFEENSVGRFLKQKTYLRNKNTEKSSWWFR